MTCRFHPVALATLVLMLSLGTLNDARAQTSQAITTGSKQEKCDRSKFRLLLDVGHTPEEPGAISARGATEYEFNLRLAQGIEKKLLDAGFGRTLLQTTGGPALVGLVRRVGAANNSNANLFLSIHHDSVPDRFLEAWEFDGKQLHFSDRFKGHSIFVSFENRNRDASFRFARLIGKELKARALQYTPHYTQAFMAERRRELLDAEFGVYRFDQLYVLRATQMPAVLLEAGSIINRDEELALASEERRDLIAASVLAAVEDFCEGRSAKADLARAK
jgi:N-acetylmuramoyl-L-alanine amidase